MKKGLSFFCVCTLIISFLCVPSSEGAQKMWLQPKIQLPEFYEDPQFLDLQRRNQLENNEEDEELDEESQGAPDAFSLILPSSVAREIRKMREQVQALVQFNQSRAGGASFGVAMIGTHEKSSEGSEGSTLPIGDMNGDGVFDFEDAVIIAQIVYGTRGATSEELTIADLNQDGEVNQWDAFLGALIYTGVITLEEAKTATPESLGLDERGIYSHTETVIDPEKGTIYLKNVTVGNLTDEDIERLMKTLVEHIERLLKLMAKLKGAESVSGWDGEEFAGHLVGLYLRFDRYVLTGVWPTY